MLKHYNHSRSVLHINNSLFKSLFQQINSALQSYEAWELAAKLTLLTLLLSPVGVWFIKPFVLTLCLMGLILPNLWRSPFLWFSMMLLTALRCYLDWPLADNHAYLLCYWCLALGLSFQLRDQNLLIKNARYLVALAFILLYR